MKTKQRLHFKWDKDRERVSEKNLKMKLFQVKISDFKDAIEKLSNLD